MAILVVNEDPGALDRLVEFLGSKSGHEVLSAASPEAAAAVIGEADALEAAIVSSGALSAGVRETARERFPSVAVAILSPTEIDAGSDAVFVCPPLNGSAVLRWVKGVPASAGEEIGDYRLLALIGQTERTEIYRAIQKSVQREVALERLKPEFVASEEALRGFRGLVRARASVVHQHIVPIYEAQEIEGQAFYTRELMAGRSLHQLAAEGIPLDEKDGLQIILSAAEAMGNLREHQVHHLPLTPHHVFLGDDGIARLANIACADGQGIPDPVEPMRNVTQTVKYIVNLGSPSPVIDHMISRIGSDPTLGIWQWKSLAVAARQGLSHVAAQTVPVPAVEEFETEGSKLVPILAGLGVLAALVFAGIKWGVPYFTKPEARDFESMIGINAGGVINADGETIRVENFWIDQYEVSISQYGEFLDALGAATEYDHPDQPPEKKGHIPKNWSVYYPIAVAGGTYLLNPIDVNCPVIQTDWWDAYAYAKWRNRRLPTAIEWDVAALGTKRRQRFPWGDEFDAVKLNSGADFKEGASGGGGIDGFNYWAPVDAVAGDMSSDGIIGLAGNVSEWTADWMPHPDFPDRQVPIIKGGSFARKSQDVIAGRAAESAEYANLALGFRTVSTDPPGID